MTAQTINIYIDTAQLREQKGNNYSLFLAKKVNGRFTVIWQSLGANATAENPAYEFFNTFNIAIPNFQVNYATVENQQGAVTFSAKGLPETIYEGQTTRLDSLGLFSSPTNDGTPGVITISNALQANPHALLLDDVGNPIFIDTESGMDIGVTTLTPIDTYQVWFDNYQDTGTVIQHNVSEVATITFSGGEEEQSYSYTAEGQWVPGTLPSTLALGPSGNGEENDTVVTVTATFTYGLTVAAVTYLLSKLIDKFSGNLRPKKISVDAKKKAMTVEFSDKRTRDILGTLGLDKFEAAVNGALHGAKADPKSDLAKETWSLSESRVGVSV